LFFSHYTYSEITIVSCRYYTKTIIIYNVTVCIYNVYLGIHRKRISLLRAQLWYYSYIVEYIIILNAVRFRIQICVHRLFLSESADTCNMVSRYNNNKNKNVTKNNSCSRSRRNKTRCVRVLCLWATI
jgi:hypothetical protein